MQKQRRVGLAFEGIVRKTSSFLLPPRSINTHTFFPLSPRRINTLTFFQLPPRSINTHTFPIPSRSTLTLNRMSHLNTWTSHPSSTWLPPISSILNNRVHLPHHFVMRQQQQHQQHQQHPQQQHQQHQHQQQQQQQQQLVQHVDLDVKSHSFLWRSCLTSIRRGGGGSIGIEHRRYIQTTTPPTEDETSTTEDQVSSDNASTSTQTQQDSSIAVPKTAWVLGWTGMMPIVIPSMLVLIESITEGGLSAAIGRDAFFFSVYAQATYCAVTIPFLSAFHLGLSLARLSAPQLVSDKKTKWREFAISGVSMIPLLMVWASQFVGLEVGIGTMMLCFSSLLMADVSASNRGLAPSWYPHLRLPLTFVALASLSITFWFYF